MPMIPGNEATAVYFENGAGPTFGSGPDLRIVDEPNSNDCSAELNNSYQCPAGENPTTFLTGDEEFRADEMEVFGFAL